MINNAGGITGNFLMDKVGAGTLTVINTTTSQFGSMPTVTPATGSTPGSISVSDPLNFLLYSSHLNIGATIQDLETMQVLQILAEIAPDLIEP